MKNKHFWSWIRDETEPESRTLYLNGVIAEESWFSDEVTPAAFKADLTAQRLLQAGKRPQQGRLAYPVGPHQADHLSGLNCQVQALCQNQRKTATRVVPNRKLFCRKKGCV